MHLERDKTFLKNVNIGESLRKKFEDPIFTKKFFVISILVNVCIYWLLSLTFLNFFVNYPLLFMDFRNFLTATGTFVTDPANLYANQFQTYKDITTVFTPIKWPIRSLPSILFYFLIFYYIPSNILITGYINSFCLVIWNLFSCYLIYKVVKNDAFKNNQGTGYFKNSFMLMSIYLLSEYQVDNYVTGNVNIIAGSFVLAGIYFYYQKKEHLTYMAWSIAGIFKIFVIVLIPFFIIQGPFKRFVKNACYTVIPQIPTLIIFALWPNLIRDIWASNWQSVVIWEAFFQLSGSIARELSNWFSMPLIYLVILFCALFFPLNLWICYKKNLSFLDRFMMGFITIIVCIPDFASIHNLIILGAYVLWISQKSSVMTKNIKVLMGIPTFFTLVIGEFFFVGFLVPSLSIYYIVCLAFIYSSLLKHQHVNTVLLHHYDVLIGITAVGAFALSEILMLLGMPSWIYGIPLVIVLLESTIPLASLITNT